MKKNIIIGITGQDGSYLAELLLSKGYEVHGFETSKLYENEYITTNQIEIYKNIVYPSPEPRPLTS